jgi:hypothetical protein
MRQILEKCNEFNITTHHLFIDFKAAYDTIIRNEVYVGMSELNFPTKLIHLTKATLTIVTCCVKIFNVVLEVIVRRANLQTTGTIYNIETQLLAYADDIDIVGRSQSAVQNAYLALEGEATKVWLKSMAIGDKHFEVVIEFVYLGSLMTPTNDVSLEIQRRIHCK